MPTNTLYSLDQLNRSAVGSASQLWLNEQMMVYFKLMMANCFLMMVKCSSMMLVYDHTLISPTLTLTTLTNINEYFTIIR